MQNGVQARWDVGGRETIVDGDQKSKGIKG